MGYHFSRWPAMVDSKGERLISDTSLREELQARLAAPGAIVDVVLAEFHVGLSAIVSTMMHEMHLGDLDSALIDDADVISAVKAMPQKQQADFLDYLSTQNSLLGESNPFISLALGRQPAGARLDGGGHERHLLPHRLHDEGRHGAEQAAQVRQGVAGAHASVRGPSARGRAR